MAKERSQRLSFDVSFHKDINEWLYSKAEAEGRSVQFIIREAVASYRANSGETKHDHSSTGSK
jgi:hypothetical protein